MNNTFKSMIFTIIGIVIFFMISWFFITLIPYLLIGGLAIYIIMKIRRSFKNKKKNYNNYDINERINTNTKAQEPYYSDNNGKVIDVEYKDVDNN